MTRLAGLDPRTSWLGFLGAAGLGLVALFVLLDPAPSRGLSLPSRTLYWIGHVFPPLALAQAVQVAIARGPHPFTTHRWLAIIVAGLMGSALFAPLAVAFDRLLPTAVPDGEGGFLPQSLIEEWLNLAPPVTLVWLGLNAVRFLQLPRTLTAPEDRPSQGRATPAFLDRLPAARRGELVALSAELHYLRVYTTKGEGLVLHGFGEAMVELGPDAGLQIHRSHWVDPRFVSGLVRRDGNMAVTTTTGLTLPVARSRRSMVAAAIGQVAGGQVAGGQVAGGQIAGGAEG